MTKYVFVLTSSPKDFYCEQTLVAVASLRVHNPGAFVTLLTDDRTLATLTGNRAALKDAVDEIKALTLDEKLTPMLRSRFLKTSIRNVRQSSKNTRTAVRKQERLILRSRLKKKSSSKQEKRLQSARPALRLWTKR